MNGNGLRRRLAAGETVTAAWLELGSPDAAEILVRNGWDVIVIDCEHGAVGVEDGLGLIRAVEAAGGDAMVRVPDASEATLKRALDRGARSLLVPMVNSAAMARDVAALVRYPPMGRRGYAASIVRASGFGSWASYAAEANADVLLAIQIEHVDAIAHLDDIATIPGIDMIFIGPNDLAGSMGHLERLDAPEVREAIAEIEGKAKRHGIMLGSIEMAGRDCGRMAAEGYRLIVGPNDVSLLAGAALAAAGKRDRDMES